MKNVIFLSIFSLLILFSCKKNKEDSYPTYKVSVQLTDTLNNNFTAVTGVSVKLSNNTTADVYNATSDANGLAVFQVPVGIYKASASITQADGAQKIVYNGSYDGDITVTNNWTGTDIAKIKLIKAQLSQVIIKEAYIGGVPPDNGSGNFLMDAYLILYNNSDATVSLSNLSIGMIAPSNPTSVGVANFMADGKLVYANDSWLPAWNGIWYFQQDISLQPGKQIVVAMKNAVNNTLTYSKSINFDNSEYYAMYDIISGYSHANTYVAPAASIPSSHYLKAVRYGLGSAWAFSVNAPGFFIFQPKGTTAAAFANDASKNYTPASNTAMISKMVPTSWILDGFEAFYDAGKVKRFLPVVDAGSIYHVNAKGYSMYRNVDKAATEAIAGNSGKLVYNYSLGTDGDDKEKQNGSTDKSGIDAEASIKNGARIVYLDNNNSTLDFHLRSKASLRAN